MGVLALAFGSWQRVLALAAVAAFLAIGAKFLWLEHQHKADQAALAREHSETLAERSKARIATAALEVSRQFHQTASNLDQALNSGREQIHAAVFSHETRDLFIAFARADRSLCDGAGGCAGDRRA